MVSPSRVADINGGWLEAVQEVRDDTQGTRARQSLDCADSVTCYVWAVPAEDSHACTLVKGIEAVNWEILLIEAVVSDELGLDLADDWEHVWLAIIVSVGTNSEVALLRVLIVLEIDR